MAGYWWIWLLKKVKIQIKNEKTFLSQAKYLISQIDTLLSHAIIICNMQVLFITAFIKFTPSLSEAHVKEVELKT